MNQPIIMLCSECFSTTCLYNHVSEHYSIDHVIVESPLRGWALAKKRFKRRGLLTTAGQILFIVFVAKLLKAVSKKRVRIIKAAYGFNETPVKEEKKKYVGSVNDEDCINFIKNIKPGIILVNGTRILSKKLLESTDAIIMNMHTGITPRYRGVHGGYWSLVKNDKENCGVTVHLVDNGIDTGNILYQKNIQVTPGDNYNTYPYLQFGEGIQLMRLAIDDIAANKLSIQKPVLTDSRLWYHPTIWQYLYHRIFRNKK
ncbi:MAG TPA: formyl transferase [Chitinophagaceae bacterium]|nr:formyl transferase [Chitinophagaceae bacterium]